MTIDELISKLQEIKSEHGNIEVRVAKYIMNEHERLIDEDADIYNLYKVNAYVRITS